MTQHTDRALADSIDALREAAPLLSEALVRLQLAQGISYIFLSVLLFAWAIHIHLRIHGGKLEDKWAWLCVLLKITAALIFFCNLPILLAPEGAALRELLRK